MAKLGLNLEGVETKTNSGLSYIEPGVYNSKIVNAEVKPNSKKTGSILSLTYEIEDGRRTIDNLNIVHPNEQAQRIAYQTLKTIATTIGHKNPNLINDTNELVGGKLAIVVADEQYNGKNYTRVKKYLEWSDNNSASKPPVSTNDSPSSFPF